jgi:uncharacterized membrane protein YfcA
MHEHAERGQGGSVTNRARPGFPGAINRGTLWRHTGAGAPACGMGNGLPLCARLPRVRPMAHPAAFGSAFSPPLIRLPAGSDRPHEMQIYLPIAEMPISIVLLLGMGLAVGVLSGMFGIGGGFILTPMLIFIGVPPPVAVGTGASLVVASSVSGALGHWHRGNVDLKLGLYLLIGGLIGTVLGIKLQQILRALGQLNLSISLIYVVILGVIGTLMLIEGAHAWRKSTISPTSSYRRGGQHTWVQGLPFKVRFPQSKLYMSVLPLLSVGAFVGALTALMGVGGGFILVPALVYLLGVPTRIVIGTSVFQIVFVTAATTILQSTHNHAVDIMLGGILMVGGVVGAQYGIAMGERLKAEQLRFGLALLVLAVAIRMAVDLVAQPTELLSIDPTLT